MRRWPGLLCLAASAFLSAEPAWSSLPPAPPYIDLAGPFARLADETVAMADDQRLARFQATIAPLFPGFYEPHDGEPPARYRLRVLASLRGFPTIRSRYEAIEQGFPAAYAAGVAHIRAVFPDFRDPAAVFFLHSLGEMDGGTRTLHGRSYLIFGADGLARYHEPDSIGAFLDHELFHVEHARYFTDCDPVWCGLWQEGLATYAAAVMNPGASDRLLMLDAPGPIRAPIDARWRAALCLLDAKRGATDQASYGLFFFGNPNGLGFPPRFGYYLGYRLVQRAARERSLHQMTMLDRAGAQALVETTLAAMIAEAGGCGAASTRG